MSASLKARLQKAEAELEVGVSHQRHLQVHLDSAATHNSALSQELEVELQNNAELASECKAHQSHCIQVITALDSIVMTAQCKQSANSDHRWAATCFACAKLCCPHALVSSQPVSQPTCNMAHYLSSNESYCMFLTAEQTMLDSVANV